MDTIYQFIRIKFNEKYFNNFMRPLTVNVGINIPRGHKVSEDKVILNYFIDNKYHEFL